MFKFIGGLLVIGLVIVAVAFAFGFISLEQTRDARLPEVAIKKGALPAYKADVAKIEVGTRNETVELPTVDVAKP
ncbi:MAG: hypothetical protein QHC40_10520 [Sphingobium sp.]|nr:hypothetical protein [Sphingobium sp.]